ncbi:MAG: single-stranded-DNA-specific exonuclease RecJ [bacterium]|nr:single-stranded-DNA-specific exonuclease RecJ [bacterium]
MEKNWILADDAPDDWQVQFPTVHPIARQLLWNREVREPAAVEQFLNPNYEKDLHDPFLFNEMEKVIARLFKAIELGEKIFVYGDYDADGVPGAAIIKSTLDALGAVTGIYIPHREQEGYGLNSGAISYMLDQGGKIVITCDCGVSNATEVDEAQSKGMDVIITDHHRIPEIIPKPFATLHPLIVGEKYPNKFLTGGGVAFKLAQALLRRGVAPVMPKADPPRAEKCMRRRELSLATPESLDGFEKWLLDLVAISTVADVGRLVGENRTFVKYGLKVINKTRRIGLQKLMESAGIKPGTADTTTIGWQIAPRINAAGRMDHANAAFELLMTSDSGEAERLAQSLQASNVERQKATVVAQKGAREQIGQPSATTYLLSAYDPTWVAGVIGLVAGKLTEEFRRPTIIGTRNEVGVITASARSINEFNVIEALAASKKYILKFGGHPRAAGFSVASEKKWALLIARLSELAFDALHKADVRPSVFIDADVTLAEIDWEAVAAISNLEPYGEGNARPRFLIHGLQVAAFDGVGNDGKHLRLTVTDESKTPRKMIGFNCGDWCDKLTIGDLIDVVAEIGVNEWNGNREIQLKIVDLRFHKGLLPNRLLR